MCWCGFFVVVNDDDVIDDTGSGGDGEDGDDDDDDDNDVDADIIDLYNIIRFN